MKIPISRPWKPWAPQKTGSCALFETVFDTGTNAWVEFCSGPPSPNSQDPTQIAIQLSMIVEITSWAPTVALSTPAMPAQAAPASVAAEIASRMCGSGLIPARSTPIQLAT